MSESSGSYTRPGLESQRQFDRARRLFPGGVNSPVRAYRAVGGTPPFIASGRGSTITDADGNTYVDLVASWGPLILGHADPKVVAAITHAAALGTSFGAPTSRESDLGELISRAMPSMERLRFVSSGTEAAMSALRVARGYTGRSKILKFDGAYHGHSDGLLVAAGSGVLTQGLATSAGVPATWAAETLSVPYNDLDAVRTAFDRFPGQIAAVIVEPVAGNMGVVPPVAGFLSGLRSLCSERGALLVFDEVITGFRVGPGGAQGLFGITPDLTCLGKIIGGGLPVGAYGGRADVMAQIAPEGAVYQAGTLSGNPVAMAAGLATMSRLQATGAYAQLETMATELAAGITEAAAMASITVRVQRVGSMLTPFFTDGAVVDEATAKRCDTETYGAWFHNLLDRGVYPPPSQFEAWFVSLAHTHADIDHVVQACRASFQHLAAGSRGL